MQDNARDEVIADIWRRRTAWAATSREFQEGTKRARQAQLILIIAGSVFATAAATDLFWLSPPAAGTGSLAQQLIAGLGAVSLASVGIVQRYFLSLERSERWPRCRSVAESLKSEVFKFRAQAKPYDTPPVAGADPALQLLIEAVAEHEGKAADLLVHVHPESTSAKAAPVALDSDRYIKERLDDQIDKYYLPSAQKNLRYSPILRETS